MQTGDHKYSMFDGWTVLAQLILRCKLITTDEQVHSDGSLCGFLSGCLSLFIASSASLTRKHDFFLPVFFIVIGGCMFMIC